MAEPVDLLQGTLELLILKAVSLGPLHGYGVLQRIEQMSGQQLLIQQGSLYPALYRLEASGALLTEWSTSENNRRAKYYRLSKAGQQQLAAELDRWGRVSKIMAAILRVTSAPPEGGRA
ncbi:PadR family transcriptional regulator [Terriglobus aquaticus]|uniref:PadR family transcriptional regulator n=1 Tax=Terriglobus aquaticus TaxID=940139 RepID=A0ABW9KHV8_9BACT|nr:PadR family transcriptional regulator [Terriglobus aquaticus]